MCSRPANSSKSQPFEITAVGVPEGASARASSAIVSVTVVSPETRANVRRAIVSSTARLARTARRSYRRCGLASQESRRSAIHGTPVRRATTFPIMWADDGGDVVRTTLAERSRTIRTAARAAFGTQTTRGSGSRSWRPYSPARVATPLSPVAPASTSAAGRSSDGPW